MTVVPSTDFSNSGDSSDPNKNCDKSDRSEICDSSKHIDCSDRSDSRYGSDSSRHAKSLKTLSTNIFMEREKVGPKS